MLQLKNKARPKMDSLLSRCNHWFFRLKWSTLYSESLMEAKWPTSNRTLLDTGIHHQKPVWIFPAMAFKLQRNGSNCCLFCPSLVQVSQRGQIKTEGGGYSPDKMGISCGRQANKERVAGKPSKWHSYVYSRWFFQPTTRPHNSGVPGDPSRVIDII